MGKNRLTATTPHFTLIGMAKNIIIKKPSAMIQTNVKELSLVQRKVVNVLIHMAQKTGDARWYSMPISDVKRLCGISTVGNEDLKEQIRALTEIRIEYNYLDKDKESTWGVSVLLAGAEMKPNSGKLEFAFSPFIQRRILDPEIYAPLDVVLISCFRSTYAIVLYEFLRDYLSSPRVPRMTIDQVRALLGVDNDKYQLFKNFRINVLDRAVSEVNDKTELRCDYRLIKTGGNHYTHIDFFVESRPLLLAEPEPNPIPAELDEILPERFRVPAIYEIIVPYCVPDRYDFAYIASNIRYSLKHAKDNLPAYLRGALEKDHAKAEREIEERRIAIRRQKAEQAQLSLFQDPVKEDPDPFREMVAAMSESQRQEFEPQAVARLLESGMSRQFMNRVVIDQAIADIMKETALKGIASV